MGLATDCTLNRDNPLCPQELFLPDLPKGYQISQFDLPICEHGRMEIEVEGRRPGPSASPASTWRRTPGKLVHDEREPLSYVDLNRTGTPLLEIVSEPDLRSPEEATAYLKKLHAIVRYLDICDGNMQEGSFRCDANISLRPVGQEEFGTRTELKNMNSFRNVQLAPGVRGTPAARCPAGRRPVVQQTLLWDPDRNRTEPMRGKEEAHDYRYFPDPDLVPVVLDEEWIEAVREDAAGTAGQRRQRFVRDFELSGATMPRFSPPPASWPTISRKPTGRSATPRNWPTSSAPNCCVNMGRNGSAPVRCAPTVGPPAELIEEGTISGKIAKTVFAEMLAPAPIRSRSSRTRAWSR
jgi:aspartyl-tRNA(Asn)/glutamyl-tRNA(Gln) amidotransferase subunit B